VKIKKIKVFLLRALQLFICIFAVASFAQAVIFYFNESQQIKGATIFVTAVFCIFLIQILINKINN
jgi:hypothetical protein